MIKVIFNILKRLHSAAPNEVTESVILTTNCLLRVSDKFSHGFWKHPPLIRHRRRDSHAQSSYFSSKIRNALHYSPPRRGWGGCENLSYTLLPLLTTCILFFIASCTKNIDVELPPPEEKIVVEGYIEQGQAPYVLLSRNSAFFGGIDVNDLEQYIVKGATVTVSDITDDTKIVTDTLDEICIDTTIGDQTVTVCAYRSLNPIIYGELRKIYSLRVAVDSIVLTARTAIPDLLKLDSIWIEPHEDPANDSLVNLLTMYKDPDTLGNYIRYFSKRNSEQFYYVFVTDDRFFNGQDFELPLQRGEDPDADFDQDTYGYFWKGDTVIIKWASINKATYDFWNTLDYETNSGGPFGSATIIKTNIEGGLGIWGGYAAFYDTLYIPK